MSLEVNQQTTDALETQELYALDWEHYNAGMVMQPSGVPVTHCLRRPKRSISDGRQMIDELAKYESLIKYEEIEVGKNIANITGNRADAQRWLWARLFEGCTGYPDQPSTLAEQRDGMRYDSHKLTSISLMLEYVVEVVVEKCVQTFKGSRICLRVWQGEEKDIFVGDFFFDEWDEKTRDEFSSVKGGVNFQKCKVGEKDARRVTFNLWAFEKVFDATLSSIEGASIASNVIFDQAHKPEFLKATCGYLKKQCVLKLAEVWGNALGK